MCYIMLAKAAIITRAPIAEVVATLLVEGEGPAGLVVAAAGLVVAVLVTFVKRGSAKIH